MQQTHRRAPIPKCDFSKVALHRSAISIKLQSNLQIALRLGWSPVNLLHIFRTPFPKNTFGWLLLNKAFSGLNADLQILIIREMKLHWLLTPILCRLSYTLIIGESSWKSLGIWSGHFLTITTALNLSGLKTILFSKNYLIVSFVSIFRKNIRPWSFQELIFTFFFSFFLFDVFLFC